MRSNLSPLVEGAWLDRVMLTLKSYVPANISKSKIPALSSKQIESLNLRQKNR